MGNYRKSFIRNNHVKKLSSEPDAVIKRATSGSRAIGSRPLFCDLSSATDEPQKLQIIIAKHEVWLLKHQFSFVILAYCTLSPTYTNGVWPFSGLWVWRRRTDGWPCSH